MYRRWLTQLGLAMVLGIGSTGCMAIGAVQTAQTLGQGNYEVSIEPGVYGAAVPGAPAGGGNVNYFSGNVAFRFGVTDRLDLGGRVGSTLAEFQTKILLSDPDNDGFALSLAPSVGGFGFGAGGASFGVLSIPVPVLIGFKFGENELTLGPRIQNVVVFGSLDTGNSQTSAGIYVLMAGLSVGFAAQLGSRFRLLPEISMAAPVFGSVSGSSGGSSGSASGFVTEAGSFLYMGNLGFQITSPRKKRKPKEQPVE